MTPDLQVIHRAIWPVTVREAEADRPATVEAIASTDAVDSYDDIVDQYSWNLDRFKSNPVILFQHRYDAPVIGRATEIGVRRFHDQGSETYREALSVSIEFDRHEDNELGRLVGGQFDRGFMRAVSVGFRSGSYTLRSELPESDPYHGDRGYLLRDNELLEISAVSIPANPEALAKSAAAPQEMTESARGLIVSEIQRYLNSPEGRLLIEATARAGELEIGLLGLPID